MGRAAEAIAQDPQVSCHKSVVTAMANDMTYHWMENTHSFGQRTIVLTHT